MALSCKVTAAIAVPILAVYLGLLSIKEKRVPRLAFWGKLAIALSLALVVFFLVYMPVFDRFGPILQSMNQHWSREQSYGHTAVISNVIYEKPPWWTYLYWYWRGDPPYLPAYGQGLLVLLGVAICFALFRRKRSDVFLLISLILPFGYLSFYLSFKMFRYAAILEPSLIILACSFIFSVSSYLKTRKSKSYIYLALMCLLAVTIARPMFITSWRTFGQEENEYKAVANYLIPKIQGHEVVFVWGYTSAMEWYLEGEAEVVGGYTTNHFEGNYDADYFVVDPRMPSRWPDDPLNTYLRENGEIYSKYDIGGLELYVRERQTTQTSQLADGR